MSCFSCFYMFIIIIIIIMIINEIEKNKYSKVETKKNSSQPSSILSYRGKFWQIPLLSMASDKV